MQSAPFDPALTCPRCNGRVNISRSLQRCTSCGLELWLHPGILLVPSFVLPPPPPSPSVRVKSAGVFLMKQGELGAYGVSEGILDPVTGMIPIEESGVAFNDVRTIAVWRRVDVLGLIAAFLLPLPFMLGLWAIAIATRSPVFAALGIPFAFLFAWMVRRAVVIRAHWARIAGSSRAITIRFDRPGRRRKLFHDELLRRAGITNIPELR